MKLKKWLSASVVLLFSHFASAEIVQGDWQQSGDNLAFVNTNDNSEWLSLSVTQGWTLAKLETELQAGGMLEGWRIPNQAELESVFLEIIPSLSAEEMYYSGGWKGIQAEEWNALRDLFWNGDRATSYLYGWTQFDGGTDFYRTGTAWSPLFSGISVTASNWGSLGNSSRADTGFFLVGSGDASLIGQWNAMASNVPVPFAGALAGMCLLGFRRKAKVS